MFTTGTTARRSEDGWRDKKVWDTGGMVEETDNLIIIIPFNDEKVLDQTVEKHKDGLAAVI